LASVQALFNAYDAADADYSSDSNCNDQNANELIDGILESILDLAFLVQLWSLTCDGSV